MPRHRRTAVDRNRLKRRLRELIRTELLGTLRARPAVDLVVRANPLAYAAPAVSLRQDVDAVRADLGDTRAAD